MSGKFKATEIIGSTVGCLLSIAGCLFLLWMTVRTVALAWRGF